MYLCLQLAHLFDSEPTFIEDTIIAVGLVPPKAGVFSEQVQHLIVVATETAITLLLVGFQSEHLVVEPSKTIQSFCLTNPV